MAMSSQDWDFGRALAVSRDSIYLISYSKQEAPDGSAEEELTQVVTLSQGTPKSFALPWVARDICRVKEPKQHDIIFGRYGEVLAFSDDGYNNEIIGPDVEGPLGRGVLRDIRLIGRHVYVCGMSRQVYRRVCQSNVLSGNWQRMDSGCVLPTPSNQILGFTSIDGFSENEIYAVGWKGEVWQYDGSHWIKRDSPTNVKLERLICATDGFVYAVGQAGVILRGREDHWDIVANDATNDQFWSAIWYQNRVWIATAKGIFMIEDGVVTGVSTIFKLGENLTFGWLTSAENRIWSIGTHHVFISPDGFSWKQIFLAPDS